MRPYVLALALSLAACGGSPDRPTTPDESGDFALAPRTRRASERPRDLDGTSWRWVEAHCTEGRLDLSHRGYSAKLRVHEDEGGLTLLSDRAFAAEGCEQTVVQRATPPQSSPYWQIDETARVPMPATPECFGRPEEPRPGEVRVTDGRLEVLTQRSQWCNGLEVRMVYERAPDELLADEQLVRRYAAHFTLGDADAVAQLFAEAGSLLEPFTRTETGDPYRHDGRAAVQRWFAETFATAPWRALRITDIESSAQEGGAARQVVTWEYMDPRLEEPLRGRTAFTIAAGEIFEAQIELTSTPNEREASTESGPTHAG